jgi:hypothetical protein
MIVKKKIRKKRSRFARYKIRWLFVFCAVLYLGFLFVPDFQKDSQKLQVHVDPNAIHTSELTKETALPKRERPVYPYSVIPGGVRNPRELAVKIGEDSVVADHYADFNISDAKIARAEETRYMYVSYRLNNKIYWTSKKIKISKGEPIITDGRCDVRARCGNQVSASPMVPTSGEEPVSESLDIPQMPLESPVFEPIADDRMSLALPTMIEPSIASLDLGPPVLSADKSTRQPYYYRPLFSLNSHNSAVPEPGSSSLLLLGMVIFIVYRFIHNR